MNEYLANKHFRMNTLQTWYKPMSHAIKTFRQNRQGGETNPDGIFSGLGGLEEIVAMFKLPLLSRFFAGSQEAQTLWSWIGGA